jgi:hypothetical protein
MPHRLRLRSRAIYAPIADGRQCPDIKGEAAMTITERQITGKGGQVVYIDDHGGFGVWLNQFTRHGDHGGNHWTRDHAREIGQALIDAAGPRPLSVPRFAARVETAHSHFYIDAHRAGSVWFNRVALEDGCHQRRLSLDEARDIASALNLAADDQDRRAS